MCTVGYHKKLNLIFKNRDKNMPTEEVLVLKPNLIAVKTEGTDYFSLGTNKHGCAFVSSAVNTHLWTQLASEGKTKDAEEQFKKENEGLVNPMVNLSRLLPEITSVDEWLDIILNSEQNYMGYNLLLSDRSKAVHIEVYKKESHVTLVEEWATISNHFQHLQHGPKKREDYTNSFDRLDAARKMIKDFVSLEDVFSALKPENGKEYDVKVIKILEFGAVVEFRPGKEVLLHISEIAWERVENVEDVLKEGEEIEVKLIAIDERSGKLKLSRKILLPKPERKN